MILSTIFSLSIAGFAVANPIVKPRQTQLANVITSCTVPNTVALTFDDGPYIYLKELVDLLNTNNITGTFFFNGNNWDCIYDQAVNMTYAYTSGHQIGSHTWSHANLSSLTQDIVQREFDLTADAILKILGLVPAFVRPPYGAYNDIVRQIAGSYNQTLVNWDFESGDADGVPLAQQEQAYSTLATQHPSTVMALNHETYLTTLTDVIPKAITELKALNYNFVSVADCLGMQPYLSVVTPSVQDATWVCLANETLSGPETTTGASDPGDASGDDPETDASDPDDGSTDDSTDDTTDDTADDGTDTTDDGTDPTDAGADDGTDTTDDGTDTTDDSTDTTDDSTDPTDDGTDTADAGTDGGADDGTDTTDDTADDGSDGGDATVDDGTDSTDAGADDPVDGGDTATDGTDGTDGGDTTDATDDSTDAGDAGAA